MTVLPSTLDRYVFGSWFRIFFLTALGFPLVSILINLTDTLNRLLDRGLTTREILVSYIYSIPENAFIVMPAAVLFATVFTVGAMGRHSELTAAKAGGLSFYRVTTPIFTSLITELGREREQARGQADELQRLVADVEAKRGTPPRIAIGLADAG